MPLPPAPPPPPPAFSYYSRRRAAASSEYTELTGTHFACLSALEDRHVPCASRFRKALLGATAGPGLLPALRAPLRLIAATAGSCTEGYACDFHCDSAARGVTEHVLWHRGEPRGDQCALPSSLPEGHRWCFGVDGYVLFDLGANMQAPGDSDAANCACTVYLPGSGVWHGTLPTVHGAGHAMHCGIGSAAVVKKAYIGPSFVQWARGETLGKAEVGSATCELPSR